MAWRACAVALCWLAVAAAYTVDCNHEYTDCDTELSKLGADEDEMPSSTTSGPESTVKPTFKPFLPTIPTETTTEAKREQEVTTKAAEVSETTESTKQGRLLNLNVDDLQNFANALHNETNKVKSQKVDLSDVNMDEEDEDVPRRMTSSDSESRKHDKSIPDKFYTNLQVPFHPLLNVDRSSAEDMDTCKENEISYKIGDRIDRGCEEVCECSPGGSFDCTPRCKHPYIRRGRRLSDPLCFESPVDECCSIVACATGNQDMKASKVEVCRYNNETHQVGEKWHIACEQTCSCERNSVVTCKPRCKKITPSEKCINVQDPNDECCEVQICDVSQDAHEEPAENVTSTTTTTTESIKGFDEYSDYIHQEAMKPNLAVSEKQDSRPKSMEHEPIGSVKVLQNNSVQVNLMHMNSSDDPIFLLLSSDGGEHFEDVELKYTNLILNLPGGKDYILKTKENGTKFNFTITASEDIMVTNNNNNGSMGQEGKPGCHQDGKFYEVGEEFHIGCTELCECTGDNKKECVELVCPSHVGLELVSKGCVRWAPSPPAQPPNCCPRTARCLSDGTCHYKGFPVPNWTEVPLTLTGCEQRCFCENGELDCQEVCSPLPPVPPQTLRCPPAHHPAPVNISDEDCCKQWGCVPNAEASNSTGDAPYYVPIFPFGTFVTPVAPVLATTLSSVPPTPTLKALPTDFYRHLHPVKTFPKVIKTVMPVSVINEPQKQLSNPLKPYPTSTRNENFTVFTSSDELPFKTIHSEKSMDPSLDWGTKPKVPDSLIDFRTDNVFYSKSPEYTVSDSAMHDLIQPPSDILLNPPRILFSNPAQNGVPKFFLPADSRLLDGIEFTNIVPLNKQNLFSPARPQNQTTVHVPSKNKNSYKKTPKLKQNTHAKHISSARLQNVNMEQINDMWMYTSLSDRKPHVLMKSPNPYETVLLRPITAAKSTKVPKIPSPLGLEQLVSQMEVESEVNRNLGRSADNVDTAEGQTPASDGPKLPPHPQVPFLPTIPPNIHFPTEEPEYDPNNIHRPIGREPPTAGLPPGFPLQPVNADENKKLSVLSLQADSPTSVKMLFGLPPVLVGLRGSVDLRYTDKPDEDISQWYSQVFAPADEVLTTPRLEFRLTGLKPSTVYKIKGKLFLHNLPVEPESQVYSVRTLDLPSVMTVEEKRREVDSRLTVVDFNDTAAHLSWRHFSEDELQFIDGIQVRYRPVGTPIYSMTELLHHSRSIAELHDLRPGTRYEASLILVPPPRATTELHDPGRVDFVTAPFVDPYDWSVTIEAHVVGSDAAELIWRGVPSPAERWVRVYRAAHTCGTTRNEHDAFRLAARDLPPTILLSGLDSNTKCRVWLELFLTNGKIKTSNVIEINTKSQDSPEEIDNEIEAASVADTRSGGRGDYYGALVVVGVVAALGALTSLLLLLVLLRRHRPRSVPITPVPTAPRESSLPPYDNPAYKLELQQETMDL